MNKTLEISGDDIALLNDEDLRVLIGLLCEADCRAIGLSPSGVIWGGHQDAKDGGLDVVVEKAVGINSGFIKKPNTGFQVKKPDMPQSGITDEMKPKGILREAIKELIRQKGSYIIISSTGSTTAKALEDRRKAMKNAVITEANHEDLHVDFYDRGRIATWVRTHPTLILWVRNKLGKSLKGWQPFENWTQPSEVQGDYLIDQEMRLYDGTVKSKNYELKVEEGLNKIRSILSSTGRCVRLAGLSGVGKTRFVQALFDEKIGEYALNPAQVFYTDMSNGPDPDPRTLAEQLIAQKTRAILIVDNCPPELHRKLTEVCSGSKTKLSLITVEYDVREDLPEETHVFRLEPASDDLIYKLIKKRFTHISDVDTRTVANFSGGNARVAIALASTIDVGQTLSGFQNEELFERLFQQRNNSNLQLLKSAQVLALVYSFEGTETNSQSELSILASLIGKTTLDLYGDVSDLRDRKLIQSRNVWRAVLPQAIANRLAKKALNTIPVDTILTMFMSEGNERLLKSFTRRLSYLHDSQIAIGIAERWLAKGGWLGDVKALSYLGISILENIAPVSPVRTLEAIERAAKNVSFATRSNPHYDRFIRLLRSLAFDESLFVRSAKIMCQFALNEEVNERHNSTKNILKSLFPLFLSGTHASSEVRYSVIEDLIISDDTQQQDLGFLLLETTLEAWKFSSAYSFDFGARPRDYGYAPKSRVEVRKWYKFFVDKIIELILLNNELSIKFKKVLSNNFRGLWTKVGLYEELEDAVHKILGTGVWGEAWIEIRKTIYYDKNKFDAPTLQKLEKLGDNLKPTALIDLVKIYALPDTKRGHGLIIEKGDFNNSNPVDHYKHAEELMRSLGTQLAQDTSTLNSILPELLTGDGLRLWSLGQGMAVGSSDKQMLWKSMRDQISLIDEDKRNITLLVGFLHEISQADLNFLNIVLDQVLGDPILKKWSATFQMAVPIDSAGIERFHKIIDEDISPVELFYNLAASGRHEIITDKELEKLLLKILPKENGQDVVLSILSMRWYGVDSDSQSQGLINFGKFFLENYDFSKGRNRSGQSDFDLNQIARICLYGEEALKSTTVLCQNLNKDFELNTIHPHEHNDLLSIIAEKQPNVFLDVFVNVNLTNDYQRSRIFAIDFERYEVPLDQITDDAIISWCEVDPQNRYFAVAQAIAPFSQDNVSGRLEWKPIVINILDKAPFLKKVLIELERAIYPSGWSGSLADVLQSRIPLLQELLEHRNAEVIAWAKNAQLRLGESIVNERERDDKWDRPYDESFE